MTDRDIMKQALEALENSVDLVREDAYQAKKLYGNYPTRQGKVNGLKVLADDHEKAITALTERLAQPEQVPVAWGVFDGPNLHDMFFTEQDAQDMARLKGDGSVVQPLCTTAPQRTWVGLTDEESERLIHNFGGDPHTLLDEVNARLKERNT